VYTCFNLILTADFQNHYNEFSLVVRLWRHLKQLQRAARTHDPEGVMNMGPGDLVPKCPACPSPGRNLDPGGELSNPEKGYEMNPPL
jgi:hypothetical protein